MWRAKAREPGSGCATKRCSLRPVIDKSKVGQLKKVAALFVGVENVFGLHVPMD